MSWIRQTNKHNETSGGWLAVNSFALPVQAIEYFSKQLLLKQENAAQSIFVSLSRFVGKTVTGFEVFVIRKFPVSGNRLENISSRFDLRKSSRMKRA